MKILIVANRTGGQPLQNQYPELARIASGNEPTILDGTVTIQSLEMALDSGQYEIVHVIGHGDDNVLAMADGTVTTTWFTRRLRAQRGLKLVFINACNSVSTGAEVHNELHCAVIAHKSPIGDAAGYYFAASVYGALARGASIHNAFHEALDSFETLYKGESQPILLNGSGLEQSAFQVEVLAQLGLQKQKIDATQQKLDLLMATGTPAVKSLRRSLWIAVALVLLLEIITVAALLAHLSIG